MYVVPFKRGPAMKEGLSSVSPKGQITIPAEMRRELGIKPKDKVALSLENGQLTVVPARPHLDAVYRSVPALKHGVADEEMARIAAEEHALHVAEEGRD